MRKLASVLSGLALAAMFAAPAAQAQITFNFQFDNTNDGGITSPIVGTGTVTLPADPGNGLFDFLAVSPVISFTFGAVTFTNAHITSIPAQVNLFLSSAVDGRQLQFANDGGNGGGPLGGALDFNNGGTVLSFQPSTAPVSGGAPNLYFVQGSISNFGNYLGLASSAAPEPGTLALLALGIAGAVVTRRRTSGK